MLNLLSSSATPTDKMEMITGHELILLLKHQKERVVPDLSDP
ncbi:MAG: hypothetical protein ACQEQO_12105 [Thermodesulfobacteriota bacterium]